MNPLRPTIWQRLIGLFWPVKVREDSTPVNPTLELLWYRGRWQLATEDALYSDGNKYRPVEAAFRLLKRDIKGWRRVLILGSGLGSAVTMLRKKNAEAAITLVELDPVVLRWALETLPDTTALHPVCANAKAFMQENTTQYDLLFADIFESRRVPRFVTEAPFLARCRGALLPGGTFVLNTMASGDGEKAEIEERLSAFYSDVQCVSFGINHVFIAKA